MQTQFVLIILLFCFIQATGCLMQGTGNVGQSISNEAFHERKARASGQRGMASTQPQLSARPKQQVAKSGQAEGKSVQDTGGGSAAQKAASAALKKAALQQAQVMRKARAAGLRPDIQPPVIRESHVPKDFKEKGESETASQKVVKKLLENNREQMSPEYREAITAYFRAIAERGRKKNIVPQKKKQGVLYD